MNESELRSALLALASNWRTRAENLVSPAWDASYADMPVTRQNQIGMAWSLSCEADKLVSMLGMDPRSLWPEKVKLPPLPDEERRRFVWSDGSGAVDAD